MSLESREYLDSPEFTKGIVRKIPSSMLRHYARYNANDNNRHTLGIISDFLSSEAEFAANAGVVSVNHT